MSDFILGLFKQSSDAAAAIYTLEMRGISSSKISLVASDKFDQDSFALTTNTKLPEGVANGATTGAAIAALAVGLTAVGTVATGGIGLLVSGPIVAALAGAGPGAAVGSIVGGIIGVTIPEHEI